MLRLVGALHDQGWILVSFEVYAAGIIVTILVAIIDFFIFLTSLSYSTAKILRSVVLQMSSRVGTVCAIFSIEHRRMSRHLTYTLHACHIDELGDFRWLDVA